MRRPGFTLVEVLVSLAIFAIAAVALSAAYTNILLAREAMRRLDDADDALARSRAALLETPGLGDAEAGGEIDLPGNRKAAWRAEVEPTAVSDLFSVTLTVETGGGADAAEPPRAQTFYLLRPGWSVIADRTKLTDAARERLRRLRGFEGTSAAESAAASASGGGRGRIRGEGGGRGGEGGGRGRGEGGGPRPGPGDGEGNPRPGAGDGPGGDRPAGERPPQRGGTAQGGAARPR